MNWDLLTDRSAAEIWDKMLVEVGESNIYQSYKWGEFRREYSSIKPCRWVARNDAGKPLALFQGFLLGKPFGIGILVSEGGPVGDWSIALESLSSSIIKTLHLKKLYLRIFPKRQYHTRDALVLKNNHWKRALQAESSGWSMVLHLEDSMDELLQNTSRNWKRNLRIAQKQNLIFERWEHPSAKVIRQLYGEMESYKGLPELNRKDEIQFLLKNLKGNYQFYICRDERGNILSIRGCILCGTHALDYFAATTFHARKTNCSYLTFWRLLQDCYEKGIRYYDLNGIDPFKNPGVYRFKTGTGAEYLEYLGEWDWASSERIRAFMNFMRYLQLKFNTVFAKFKRMLPK